MRGKIDIPQKALMRRATSVPREKPLLTDKACLRPLRLVTRNEDFVSFFRSLPTRRDVGRNVGTKKPRGVVEVLH